MAAADIGASIVIAITQVEEDARRYFSVTSVLLPLLAMGAIIRRVRLHAEINMLTVLAAVCIYVLLGLSFAFVFECVGEFGSRPFFTAHEAGTRSDYRISASSPWLPCATATSRPKVASAGLWR